jgi:hypothetical protein
MIMMISAKYPYFQQNSPSLPIIIVCGWALLCLLLMTTPTLVVAAGEDQQTPAEIGNEIKKEADGLKDQIKDSAVKDLPDGKEKTKIENAISKEIEKVVDEAEKIKKELNDATKGGWLLKWIIKYGWFGSIPIPQEFYFLIFSSVFPSSQFAFHICLLLLE